MTTDADSKWAIICYSYIAINGRQEHESYTTPSPKEGESGASYQSADFFFFFLHRLPTL